MPDVAPFLPVRELSARIRRGSLSPVALAEECLDRLERLGPRTHAVITLMRESGLADARSAEREIRAGRWRGPLHGISYGAKDLLATKGVPTTWGAEPYRNQVFDYDATVITRLREAGAVLVAKLAMVELAGRLGYDHAEASFPGLGLTPWNPGFWSGGRGSQCLRAAPRRCNPRCAGASSARSARWAPLPRSRATSRGRTSPGGRR